MAKQGDIIHPLTDDETQQVAGGSHGLDQSWKGWDMLSAGDVKNFKSASYPKKYAKGPDLWKVAKVPIIVN